MVLLHIASIEDNPFSGVCCVVPKHIEHQSEYADCALLNVKGVNIRSDIVQLKYTRHTSIHELPAPYNRPDIIVFHEVYYPAYLSLANQSKKLNIPYIIIPHGCLTTNAQKQKKYKKILGNFLLFNRFIKNATAMQFLSIAEMNRTKVKTRSFIGTNGIEHTESNRTIAEKSTTQIVYIGRLDITSKGIDILLNAITLVKEFMINSGSHLDIYGPDSDDIHEYIIRTITEHSLEKVVSLHNEVYGNEKKRILNECDLFIQTSRSEGMPMGLLEAMDYGIPTIVTTGTTLGDSILLYNAGWVADTDSNSVAYTIKAAISDKSQWKTKSINAIKLVSDNYSWDKVAQNTIVEYRKYICCE